jgi:predicted Rdx family selenoprotein
VSLATELQALGHEAEAVSGQNSQFDVVADGTLVFSKQAEGRFPEHDEVLAKLG